MLKVIFLALSTMIGCLAAERYVVLVSIDGLAAFYFDDPKAPMPTLRRLAAQGARAGGVITSFPSVTWPSHTALITGAPPARHGILSNAVIDRATGKEVTYIGDPNLTKAESVRVPTLYDAVHAAGLRAAGVIWPATAGAPSLRWAIPDTSRADVLSKHTTPGFGAELDAAGIPFSKLAGWGWNKDFSGVRDLTYTRIVTFLLDKHQPHLTLLHLISPDGYQHNYGPRAEESYWSIAHSDDRIREIWDALQKPPLAGKSTLFVVSDHGFGEFDKTIHPNVLLKELGLITGSGARPEDRKAWFHSGASGVYLFDRSDRDGAIARLAPQLARIEGVDRVILPEEFARLGVADPETNPQQPDIMLSPKEGYSFSSELKGGKLIEHIAGRKGTHGHLPDRRFAHAFFVAAGSGIRPGIRLDRISNLDVAPTIAALLGVKIPAAEGRVLKEILTTP